MTPENWYRATIGKSIDTDNYPRDNPFQCWDYFDKFCREIHCDCSRWCGDINKGGYYGYVGYLWHHRYERHYNKYFDFVSPSEIKEGDWLFWDKHVAFYYHGLEVGQNQNGKRYVSSKELNRYGLLGGMRWKYWEKSAHGVAESFSRKVAGTYVTTDYVNIRTGGSTNYEIITCVPKGTRVDCYGYYHTEKDTIWLYVAVNTKDIGMITGFMCSTYLEKR